MAFKRIDRRTVPDTVFEQLMGEVLDGELAPGAALPAERQLAEALGVSRPTVREALQRLAHSGLVEVRQGGSTTVRDYRRHAGMDVLPRLLVRKGEIDRGVIGSILETRRVLGREVAGLAAERAGAGLAEALDGSLDALGGQRDPVGQQLAAVAFWDVLVDGADSIVFRLLYNDLRAVYEPAIEALAGLMAPEVGRIDAYRKVAAAVLAGDGAAARETAADLLALASAEFDAFVRRIGANEG
ncbi:FadR/GntR family transcriptional regulator [Nocardia inohanensis]|uniref:FadR/GntR family transcriptional regulator n=1 Tax=Nocardia inohanensis TaxID=209246 RepID=UPI00082A1039|nr:GntR family transcriptional regulator [Nocardia inohanensis]